MYVINTFRNPPTPDNITTTSGCKYDKPFLSLSLPSLTEVCKAPVRPSICVWVPARWMNLPSLRKRGDTSIAISSCPVCKLCCLFTVAELYVCKWYCWMGRRSKGYGGSPPLPPSPTEHHQRTRHSSSPYHQYLFFSNTHVYSSSSWNSTDWAKIESNGIKSHSINMIHRTNIIYITITELTPDTPRNSRPNMSHLAVYECLQVGRTK